MPTSMSVRSGVTLCGHGSPVGRIGGARSQAPCAQRTRASSASAAAALPSTIACTSWNGGVGHAGEIDAARIVEAMRARVPAPGGEIEPARERERVVDHDDLLVLRGAEREVVVEAEADLLRRAPTHRRGRKQLALAGIEDRIVPHQNMNEELRTPFDDRGEEFDEAFGKSVVGPAVFADQPGAAVEVPADDEGGRARVQQRLAHRTEILAGIDQHGRAAGALAAPGIVAGPDQGRCWD